MGLRERKKEQTRRTIADAAFVLFAQHGFHATTVADIAAAADISPRTFFSYFPSKEAVVFADLDDWLATLERHLTDRAAGETAFDALRGWILDLVADEGPKDLEREGIRFRLVCDNESLAAFERHALGRFEALVATAVAADLGDEPRGLRPRMAAAAAVAALQALRPDDPEEHGKPVDAEGLAQLDDAIAFLRGGIAALQEREPSPSR
jgi:AcrR family transcriptional regulator